MSDAAARLAQLKAAIATGALEVQNGAERVRYRSLDDMLRAQAMLEEEVSGGSAVPRSLTRVATVRT